MDTKIKLINKKIQDLIQEIDQFDEFGLSEDDSKKMKLMKVYYKSSLISICSFSDTLIDKGNPNSIIEESNSRRIVLDEEPRKANKKRIVLDIEPTKANKHRIVLDDEPRKLNKSRIVLDQEPLKMNRYRITLDQDPVRKNIDNEKVLEKNFLDALNFDNTFISDEDPLKENINGE